MEQLSALRTGLGTAAKTRIGVSNTTCKINDKNQIKEQLISSQSFHRTTGGHVQKITAEERFESRTLKSFDLTTQELCRLSPRSNLTKLE
jgi:phosphoribulokinase